MNFDRVVEISYAIAGKHDFKQRCRHFSFIMDGNRILSIGFNKPKTHPYNLKFNYINKQKDKISEIVGTHSEMNAVLKHGRENCKNLILVNTRINRNDELDYSKPCSGCLEMVNSLGFKKIYYSNRENGFSCLIPKSKLSLV